MALPLPKPQNLEIIDFRRTYTAEEFMALPLDNDKRYELVKGIVKEMPHPGREHMLITDNVYGALRDFVRANKLGRVLPPGAFQLSIPGATKDTVRSPDLVFLVMAKVVGPPGAIKDIPDLAIEVYSPNDRPGLLQEKLTDYQLAGWDLIWVIYPPTASPRRKAGTVDIYRLQEETALSPALTVKQGDTLLGEGVLEGFRVLVTDLFE